MIRSGAIGSVLVTGGGITGWSAAAALKRHLPMLRVTVLPIEPPADALADRLSGTLPSIANFHDDLGLDEANTVVRAQSSRRLGTLFKGWGRRAYVHAYGQTGQAVGPCAFHQLWLRDQRGAFEDYSLAAMAARAGRNDGGAAGLHLTVPRYCAMMRAFALHLGVELASGDLAGVSLAEDGFIAHLVLSDGRRLEADLFVDATGPAADLHSALGEGFDDWSRHLIADRVYFSEAPATAPTPLDTNGAVTAGWTWAASSAAIATSGFVTSSAHHHAAPDGAQSIPLRQGRRTTPWIRNCVVIGDAALAIEPLEWTNLHLAHSGIDRLVAMMPGKDFARVELAEYNRQSDNEARRVRDFLCLHYAAGPAKLGPFWRDASKAVLPDSLAHTLMLFRERGRLPFYEEETFNRDSWLTVLFGQDERPRRIDPLTELVPRDEVSEAFRAMKAQIAATLAAPSHERMMP